ncbi:transmembrane protein CCDC163 [Callithrix jacchus]
MNRSLSRFEQLSVLLNATDGNVSQIKVRGQWRPPVCVGRLKDSQSSLARATVLYACIYHYSFQIPTLSFRLNSVTGALRQAVQGLLEEREQQKYQISVLEARMFLSQFSAPGWPQAGREKERSWGTAPLHSFSSAGQHQELLLKQLAKGRQSQASSYKVALGSDSSANFSMEDPSLLSLSCSAYRPGYFLLSCLLPSLPLLTLSLSRALLSNPSAPCMRNCPHPHEGSECAEEDSHGEGERERFGST